MKESMGVVINLLHISVVSRLSGSIHFVRVQCSKFSTDMLPFWFFPPVRFILILLRAKVSDAHV